MSMTGSICVDRTVYEFLSLKLSSENGSHHIRKQGPEKQPFPSLIKLIVPINRQAGMFFLKLRTRNSLKFKNA